MHLNLRITSKVSRKQFVKMKIPRDAVQCLSCFKKHQFVRCGFKLRYWFSTEHLGFSKTTMATVLSDKFEIKCSPLSANTAVTFARHQLIF